MSKNGDPREVVLREDLACEIASREEWERVEGLPAGGITVERAKDAG